MIVLVYAFSGVLTAILSVPKLTPTADSFEQVLTRKDLQVTIERNSLLTQQLMVNSISPRSMSGCFFSGMFISLYVNYLE